jgi:hypothetical protein
MARSDHDDGNEYRCSPQRHAFTLNREITGGDVLRNQGLERQHRQKEIPASTLAGIVSRTLRRYFSTISVNG